ncbi:MAG TPA: hypothetical protein VIJ77_11085, partial [Candidatus Tumulicola sp.]
MRLKALFRIMAAAAVTASLCWASLPASADGIENVYEGTIVPGANDAIKNALDAAQRKREAQRRQAAAAAGVTPSTSL